MAMNYLDPIPERKLFTPKPRYKAQENFTDLQNLGHEKVAEDFADSPHVDRKEHSVNADGICNLGCC